MRRLFDENEDWTDEGHVLYAKAAHAIQPIIDEAVLDGLSIHDVENVLHNLVVNLTAVARLRRQSRRSW